MAEECLVRRPPPRPKWPGSQAAAKHLPDIQLRFATLLDRLGPALDGPGTLADADAWYFILEGTSEPSVAEAQAMAITELAAHAAVSPWGQPRAMLLAADDYSAVSGRVPLSNLYERGRSLGIGVQVSAQSWQGLGADDDERYRIAATADGGIFVLHTPYPEPLTQLAGTRRVLETAHKLVGNTWGDEGTTREQRAWTADPDLIRRLDIGQACYIHRGAATFVQVARPKPSPSPSSPTRRSEPRRCCCPPPATRPRRIRGRPRTPRIWEISSAPEPPDDQSDPMIWNPFAVLGLPEWPDLEDETVHAAWQVIAAETHPDRPDGGNLARYTQATAAYCQLSCPCGRSEAYAGLLEPAWAERPVRRLPGRPPPGYRLASYLLLADPAETGLGPVPLAEVRRVLAEFPARIRRGHPGRMAVRATVVTGLCLTLLAVFPGDPLAAFAVVVLALVFLRLRPPGPGALVPASDKKTTTRDSIRTGRAVPPAGPRAPGWARPAPGCRPVAGRGPGACPSPPRRPGECGMPPVGRQGRSSGGGLHLDLRRAACPGQGRPTVTGWTGGPPYAQVRPPAAKTPRESLKCRRPAGNDPGKAAGLTL